MSIVDRIKRMAKANVNDLLDRTEDSEKLLKQNIRELEEAVRQAKHAAGGFAVSFRKIEKECEQLKRLKAEWGNKAESSIKLDDEETARRALEEKLRTETRLKDIEPSLAESKKTYETLKQNLGKLQDKLRASKLKLSELQSRQQAASAEKSFGETLNRAADVSGDQSDLEKMEEKVLQAEAEVEIERDMRGAAGDDYDMEEKTLSMEVDSELEALKKKLKE